jgi:hypothetical protein
MARVDRNGIRHDGKTPGPPFRDDSTTQISAMPEAS